MAKDERIYLRISAELKRKLQDVAKQENRTVSNYIENLIKKAIEKKEG